MQLAGFDLVDPASVRPYYEKKGLSLELLSKCNSQEFRFIDGYGLGYFLLTSNQDITTESAALTVSSRTVNLKVLDKQSLEHPNFSSVGLTLYITAEPKYLLQDEVVERNYNVLLNKSLGYYTNTLAAMAKLDPDTTPKTLEQIIDDFLTPTLSYDADTITPYNVSIEGLSAFDAIDLLCSIYGLVWTYDGTTVYIHDLDDYDSSGILPGLSDPINDIRHSILSTNVPISDISFPLLDYCRQEPSERYVYETGTPGQGSYLHLHDPFTPGIANALGTIQNTTELQTQGDLIISNFDGVHNTLDYVAKHHFEALPLSYVPLSLSEVYGDWGAGPRSIYRSIPWPYYKPPLPKVLDRYANNWVGTLTDGYWEIVSNFTVTPLFGLDGKIPPGDQTVDNIYSWDYGAPGAVIRIEWDCINARWIPLQQEYVCPPTEDPGYEESPPNYPFPPEEPLP